MVQFNTNNIFKTLSYVTPVIVILLVIMIGVIEDQFNLSTMVYIGGVMCSEIINVFYGSLSKNTNNEDIKRKLNPKCSFFTGSSSFLGSKTLLSSSIILTFFTLTSSIFSMVYFNNLNLTLFLVLFVLTVNDVIQRVFNLCISRLNVFISAMIGIVFSLIWYSIIITIDEQLLLFSVTTKSNNVQCSKPNKNKFKCSVYKNGQLIR